MATVDIYVDPDATGTASGNDWANAYTSLAAAVTARATNLVTAGDTHHYHCRASSGSADATTVDLSSYTTDSSNTVIIEGEDDFGGAWDTSSYRLATTEPFHFGGCQDVLVVNLQISASQFGGNVFHFDSAVAYDVLIDGCLIDYGSCSCHYQDGSSSGSITWRNCVAFGSMNQTALLFYMRGSGTTTVENCTIVDDGSNAGYVLYRHAGTAVVTNTVVFCNSSGVPFYGTMTADGCASNPADSVGTNYVDLSSYTAAQIFEDPSSDDYHIHSGLGAGPQLLMAAGTDLSATFEDDIDGDPRLYWDIGADEVAVTTTTINVDPDGGGDYTSLAGAVAANAGNLITAREIHHYLCRASSGSADTSSVDVEITPSAGYVTDENNYVIIESADDHEGVWDTSSYRLSFSGGSYGILVYGADGLKARVIGLQIERTNTSTGYLITTYGGGASYDYDIGVDNCIMRAVSGNSTTAVYWRYLAGDSVMSLRNSIIYDCYRGFYTGYGTAGAVIDVQNCTVLGVFRGFVPDRPLCTITNCVAVGATDDYEVRDGTIEYSASGNGSETGTGNVDLSSYTLAQIFEDPSNDDYHIHSGLGAGPQLLMAAGTDLSATFEDDIDGDPRLYWDIGADEIAVTTVDIYVDPDATGSADGTDWTDAYTSIRAAIAAEATDLTTARNIHHYHCRSSSGSADYNTQTIDFDDYTCDEYGYVIVESEDDHGGIWDETKYRVGIQSGTNIRAFDISDDNVNVELRGLQIRHLNDGSGSYGLTCRPSTASTYVRLMADGCIIRGPGSATAGFGVHFWDTDSPTTCEVTLRNCIVYDFYDGLISYDEATVRDIQNNTIVDNSHNGMIMVPATDTAASCYNNIVFGNTNADIWYDRDWINYCASSDGIAGSNPIDLSSYTLAQIFADPANDDYHLGSGAGAQALFEAGTDLSSTFANDIDGQTRVHWDIGADDKQDATVINIYVDPDASGSADGTSWTDAYTSIVDAWSAEAGDLVAARMVHHYHCRSSSGGEDLVTTGQLDLSDYTTSSTYAVTVQCYESDGTTPLCPGAWDATEYRVRKTGSGRFIASMCDFTVRGLQLHCDYDYYNTGFYSSSDLDVVADFVAEQCLIRGYGSSMTATAYPIFFNVTPGSSTSFVFRNIVCHGFTRGIYTSGGTLDIEVQNCTLSATNETVRTFSSSVNFTNCAFLSTDGNTMSVNQGTFMNCANDEYTAVGTNPLDISSGVLTDYFTSASDFHLASGSTLIGAGTDLSSIFTTDIDGETRSSWDIGADEYSSSGADHELTIGDLTASAHILESPVMSQAHDLNVAELTSNAPVIDQPTLTTEGEDELTIGDLAGAAPVIDQPTIGQAHGLAVADLYARTPLVDQPTIGSVHDLTVADLYARTPLIDQPSMGGAVGLSIADYTAPRPQLDGAPLTQAHVLAAADLDAGTPTIDQPTLGGATELTIADLTAGTPTVDEPTLGQAHDLTVDEMTTGTPVLDEPAIGQSVSLGVDDLTAGVPTIDQIILTGEGQLAVLDLTSGTPAVDQPTLGQAHGLSIGDLSAGAVDLGTLTLGVRSVLAIADLAAGTPTIDGPTLELNALGLDVDDVTAGTPVVDAPTIGQAHALAVAELTAGVPTLGVVTVNPYANAEIIELTGSITRTVGMTAGLTRTVSLTATLREDLYG